MPCYTEHLHVNQRLNVAQICNAKLVYARKRNLGEAQVNVWDVAKDAALQAVVRILFAVLRRRSALLARRDVCGVAKTSNAAAKGAKRPLHLATGPSNLV